MIVIVGASLAGATTAFELRRLGVTEPITLIGDEAFHPYERPELSKGFLTGSIDEQQLMVRSFEDYADNNIATELGRKILHITDIKWDTLVIATGSRNKVLKTEDSRVMQLRTIQDSLALKSHLTPGKKVACLGMGFIGAEIASTARHLGVDVETFDALDLPMLAALGPDIAAYMADLHERNGVVMNLGAITKPEDIDADVIVVGIGVQRNSELVNGTAITTDNGRIVIDATGRTSMDNVYAVGDVANHHEHWQAAINGAKATARAIAGLEPEPVPAPYFWSVQYGKYLQMAGNVHQDSTITFLEKSDDGFLAHAHTDDELTGVVAYDYRKAFTQERKKLATS